MSRHQRRQADTAVTLNLNVLAASCNAACGQGNAMLWDKGEGALPEVEILDSACQHLNWAARNDRPGIFAEDLGELVFEALALAGALGVDIALEVELCRKRTEKAGK